MEERLDAMLEAVAGYLRSLGLLGGTLGTVGVLAIASRIHKIYHAIVRKGSCYIDISRPDDGSTLINVRAIGSHLRVSVTIYYNRRKTNENHEIHRR